MFCNNPVRPPLTFFGEEAHPHFYEQEEKLLDLYDEQDDYNYGNKSKNKNTTPSLYLFIGCNFLNIDRKSCPEHLNDIQKLCLVKLLNAKKRVIDDPMVVINVAQENSQVKLEELLTRPNHLVLQDISVDKILSQIIEDCGLTEEIDKIEQGLVFPEDASTTPSRNTEPESPIPKKDSESASNKFEEEKEVDSSDKRGLEDDDDKDEDDNYGEEETEFAALSMMGDRHVE